MNVGLLLLRLVVGLYLFGHGAQKLFGWFGGSGMAGTRGMIERLGGRPTWFWAPLSGLSEACGGLLLALGFLNPVATFPIAGAMLTAIFAVHWRNGLWNTKRGIELPFTYLSVAVAVALTGPGAYSLDRLLGIALPEPVTWIVLTVLLLAGLAWMFSARRPSAAPAQPSVRAPA